MANLVDEIKSGFSSRKVTPELLYTSDSFNRNLQIIAESLVYYEIEIKSVAQDLDFITTAWDAIAAYQSSFVLIKRLKYDKSNPELFMYNHSTLKSFNAAQNSLEHQIHLKATSGLKSVTVLSEVIDRNKEVFHRNVDLLVQKKTEMKFDW